MTILDGWTDKIGLHGEEFQTGIFQMKAMCECSVQSVQHQGSSARKFRLHPAYPYSSGQPAGSFAPPA